MGDGCSAVFALSGDFFDKFGALRAAPGRGRVLWPHLAAHEVRHDHELAVAGTKGVNHAICEGDGETEKKGAQGFAAFDRFHLRGDKRTDAADTKGATRRLTSGLRRERA